MRAQLAHPCLRNAGRLTLYASVRLTRTLSRPLWKCTLAAVGGTSESDDGLELSDADSEGVDGGAAAAAAVLLQTYATQVQEQRPEPTQQQQQQQQQQAPAALVAHGVTPTLPPPSERPESHALVVPEALPGPAGRVQHTAGATGGTAGGWAKAMEQQQQLTAEQATDDGDLAADAAWALLTPGVLGGAWPADGMHSIAEVLADGAARRVARVAGVLRQREAGAAETGQVRDLTTNSRHPSQRSALTFHRLVDLQRWPSCRPRSLTVGTCARAASHSQVHCVLTDPSGSMTATLHDGAVDSLPALSGEEDPAVLLSDVPLLRADKGHVSLMVMANRIEACVTATGMAAP